MASPAVAGNGVATVGDVGGASALSPAEFRALLYNPPAESQCTFPTLCDFANRGEKVPQHVVDTRTKFWENKGLKLPAWAAPLFLSVESELREEAAQQQAPSPSPRASALKGSGNNNSNSIFVCIVFNRYPVLPPTHVQSASSHSGVDICVACRSRDHGAAHKVEGEFYQPGGDYRTNKLRFVCPWRNAFARELMEFIEKIKPEWNENDMYDALDGMIEWRRQQVHGARNGASPTNTPRSFGAAAAAAGQADANAAASASSYSPSAAAALPPSAATRVLSRSAMGTAAAAATSPTAILPAPAVPVPAVPMPMAAPRVPVPVPAPSVPVPVPMPAAASAPAPVAALPMPKAKMMPFAAPPQPSSLMMMRPPTAATVAPSAIFATAPVPQPASFAPIPVANNHPQQSFQPLFGLDGGEVFEHRATPEVALYRQQLQQHQHQQQQQLLQQQHHYQPSQSQHASNFFDDAQTFGAHPSAPVYNNVPGKDVPAAASLRYDAYSQQQPKPLPVFGYPSTATGVGQSSSHQQPLPQPYQHQYQHPGLSYDWMADAQVFEQKTFELIQQQHQQYAQSAPFAAAPSRPAQLQIVSPSAASAAVVVSPAHAAAPTAAPAAAAIVPVPVAAVASSSPVPVAAAAAAVPSPVSHVSPAMVSPPPAAASPATAAVAASPVAAPAAAVPVPAPVPSPIAAAAAVMLPASPSPVAAAPAVSSPAPVPASSPAAAAPAAAAPAAAPAPAPAAAAAAAAAAVASLPVAKQQIVRVRVFRAGGPAKGEVANCDSFAELLSDLEFDPDTEVCFGLTAPTEEQPEPTPITEPEFWALTKNTALYAYTPKPVPPCKAPFEVQQMFVPNLARTDTCRVCGRLLSHPSHG